MRDALSTALKLLLAVFLLAVGIAALDLRVIQPFRTPPCNPETLEEGHVCLAQVLKEWPGKVIWIDARKQDDFERHTITQAPVYPIRPADANYQELLANAMEALMTAEDKGCCIVIFCSNHPPAVSHPGNQRARQTAHLPGQCGHHAEAPSRPGCHPELL